MREPFWDLFYRTGLPQAYCCYAHTKRRKRDVPDGQRTDHPQREL